jgi:hypothetical protein
VILQGRDGRLLGVLPVEKDPTLEFYGWDQLAFALRDRGLIDQPGTFLFTSTWFDSGQLAFRIREAMPVLCYRAGGAHAFADWSRPEDWVGWDGILTVSGPSSIEPQVFDRWFERIEPLEPVTIRRGGVVVRTMALYRCVGQLQPFPFRSAKKRATATLATRTAEPNRVR